MLYSLARLRFLVQRDIDDAIREIMRNLGRLSDDKVAQLLYVLAMTDVKSHTTLARLLVVQYGEGRHPKLRAADVDAAWALCALGLAKRYKKVMDDILMRVFDRSPPQNFPLLLKLYDVVCAADLEHFVYDADIPSVWRTAVTEAAKSDMHHLTASRHEGSHSHGIRTCLESLHEDTDCVWEDVTVPQLQMKQNVLIGPVRVELLDEVTHLVVDTELAGSPVTRRVRHQLVKLLGYKPFRVESWDWQQAGSEADRRTFLARHVRLALAAA